MSFVDHGPVPDGDVTLDELVLPLIEAMAGRETFSEWVKEKINAAPSREQLQAQLADARARGVTDVEWREISLRLHRDAMRDWARHEFAVEKIAWALWNGTLQTVVWNPDDRRFERLIERGWKQLGEFVRLQAVRCGWLEPSIGEPFTEHRWRYVLVSCEEKDRFIKMAAGQSPCHTGPAPHRAKTRGRPAGRNYAGPDGPLLDEMHELLRSRKCTSPTEAARRVIGDGSRAKGAGTLESKATRLVRAYSERNRE